MFICKKKGCKRKDGCSHSKKHLPHDGLEMGCINGTLVQHRRHKTILPKHACPGCTWVGKGPMPYNPEIIYAKQRRRTLWGSIDTPKGTAELGASFDEGKKLEDLLLEEGVLV